MSLSNIAVAIDTEHDDYRLIEVGLTTIDLSKLQILNTYSIPINIDFELSDEISKLTGWTTKRLRKQGVPTHEALRRLTDTYGCCSRLLVVDDSDEVSFLNKKLFVQHYSNRKLSNHVYNISIVHKLRTNNLKSVSLEETLSSLGLAFEGTPHRASVDSYNIARAFIEQIRRIRNNGQI